MAFGTQTGACVSNSALEIFENTAYNYIIINITIKEVPDIVELLQTLIGILEDHRDDLDEREEALLEEVKDEIQQEQEYKYYFQESSGLLLQEVYVEGVRTAIYGKRVKDWEPLELNHIRLDDKYFSIHRYKSVNVVELDEVR